ncbi:MAG: hypothetical protein SGJ27_09115 [Candidatus Melainabacteria bacterium]|nr:hypothetical protein [Candidatus Melainabacteria bacterium]
MGQNNDAAQLPQASKDANALLDRQTQGLSADCLFQNWPKDRQLEAYRELNKIQDPTDKVPDLTISFDSNGRHLVSRGGNDNAKCAPQDVARPTHTTPERARQVDRSSRGDRSTEISPRETERLAHPERPAAKIESLAKLALSGDERSKLDLRKEMEKLSKEPNKEFQQKVLQKMVEDGTYLANPFNGKPHVVPNKDASGKIESVTFSQSLGVKKQEIPFGVPFDQQVDTAQKNYKTGLQNVVGGLGKFDTGATMRAMEILDGAQPTENFKWFMLARKDQGKQPVDQ